MRFGDSVNRLGYFKFWEEEVSLDNAAHDPEKSILSIQTIASSRSSGTHAATRTHRNFAMIVGRGLLAQAFAGRLGNDPDVTVFASGVSNSLETSAASFRREHDLLDQHLAHGKRRFVYFSSCGVTNDETALTPYMKHKKQMESLVLSSPTGMVLRLPQVVGATKNPHTLTNFICNRILSGEYFSIWANAERNLIDIDDVVAIGTFLISQPAFDSAVFSIAAARSLRMPEIVKIFERILGRSAQFSIEEKGTPLCIDTGKTQEVAAQLGIELTGRYIENVICKYYAPR